MKTLNLLQATFFILALAVISCNRQPSFLISGEINSDSEYIYLQTFRNKMFFITDSSKIENGTFSFTGTVERPDIFGLTTDREETFQPYSVFLENSDIRVKIDENETSPLSVSGSSAHDLFESYRSNRRNIDIDSFITENSTSTVAAYILYRDFATRFSADELERNVNRFDPSLHDLPYIQELLEVISTRRKVDIGRQAIDFAGTTPEGDAVRMSDFGGNYLLLEFWASWCAPCRLENPNLVNVYDKFNPKGFEILAVSLDNNKQHWQRAIEADQLTWTQVSDLKYWDSEPARIYGIRNIPANILIDPSGKIIDKNLKGEDLGNRLAEIYGTL